MRNFSYLYNNDGTLQSQEIITGNNTSFIEYQNYKKRSDEGLVAYLPQKMVVTKKRNGMPDIVNVTNITYYDNSDLIHTKTEAVGKYGETLTTYTYYPKGNVNTVSVTPKDIKESVTTYSYSGDSYYTFPSNVKTNTGGIDLSNISYYYDYTTGNVKTKTDNITNQTISYEYNSFGKKIKEVQPNGSVITYKTEWSNVQPNSVFKETMQSSSINHIEITYFDKYGREVDKTISGWQGKPIVSSKSYNPSTGLLEKEIHPHYAEETEKYTTYNYGDYLNRLSSENFFDGINSLTTTYSYPYNSHITSVASPDGQTKTTETDASGLVVKITDAGGCINYQYDANGQPLTISSNETTTSILYDEMGRQHKLIDPNAGTIEYYYYADGQLKQQISANGDVTDIVYDDAERLKTKTITNKNGGTPTENVTTYYYVPNNDNGAGEIDYVEQKFNGTLTHKQDFNYNNHHQLSSVTEIYDNQTVTTSYEYDEQWRQVTVTSPTGLVSTNVYNEYGDVYQVRVGNKVIWEGKEQNSSGQWLKYTLGNGLQTDKTFTNRQETATIKTGIDNNGINNATIQNLYYGYDALTGNLLTRNDLLNNRNETFTYDNLDRLLSAKLTGSTTSNFSMTYKPNGNIDTKSDVGTYQYNSSRPNAMSGISGIQAGVSTDKQFITYSTFNKVTEIRQGIDENTITKKYNIYYGLDEQRIKSVYTDENNNTKTRYYFGTYEKDIDKFGNATQTDSIYTPAGLTAMVKGGVLYYLHTDNLGSIQAITDENKAIVSSYYYTPWGGRILLSGANITDRGYTFHEHLEPFGLINMNGRVCDPVLARFLSPDNYVQAPDYTQNFNRYSYAYNNPFKYTDPSGELQIGPFYMSLNLGYSRGGFSIGISAGVGIENEASAGIYIGYNTSGSFSFSASVGAAGFYASGGYDTKGGWFGSAGWSAPIPTLGILSFNTNLTSMGVDYSQNGGWSGNYMGAHITQNGMSFEPSVGVSTMLYSYDIHESSVSGCSDNGNRFKNNKELRTQINNEIGNLETIESELATEVILATYYGVNGIFGDQKYYLNDGMLYNTSDRKGKNPIGGVTIQKRGLLTRNESKIYISPAVKGYVDNGKSLFKPVVVHEMIHAYHYKLLSEGKITPNQFNKYSEAAAYSYDLAYYKLYSMTSQLTIARSYILPYPVSMNWRNISNLIKF